MAKSVKLLLSETVDNLGIPGDVVSVRTGYARNFLLPRGLAEKPSEERIKELAAKRADAQKAIAAQRKQREELSGKLKGLEITLVRSCNDMGILYGAITQQDIATALTAMGHNVKAREVRIASAMKRVDSYDVHVRLDSDLDSLVKVIVKADRELEIDRASEAAPVQEAAAEEAAPVRKRAKGEFGGEDLPPEKGEKAAKSEGEKPAKKERAPKGEKKSK
jgi:large subunit ribosomal protein L9